MDFKLIFKVALALVGGYALLLFGFILMFPGQFEDQPTGTSEETTFSNTEERAKQAIADATVTDDEAHEVIAALTPDSMSEAGGDVIIHSDGNFTTVPSVGADPSTEAGRQFYKDLIVAKAVALKDPLVAEIFRGIDAEELTSTFLSSTCALIDTSEGAAITTIAAVSATSGAEGLNQTNHKNIGLAVVAGTVDYGC